MVLVMTTIGQTTDVREGRSGPILFVPNENLRVDGFRCHGETYARDVAGRPREVPADLVDGWPDQAADDPVVEAARQVALNLRQAKGDRSARAVGETCGVDHTTVLAILKGAVWADLRTLGRLEAGLGVRLWPDGVEGGKPL